MLIRNRLRRPPRITLRPVTDIGAERHASWLELFFDLIFVLVVAQVALAFDHDLTVAGFLRFTFLFALLWWAWVGYTFYADRFESDCDIVYRLMMIGGMLTVAAFAVNVPRAFNGDSLPFIISYVLVRVVLIALYIRSWLYVHMARELSRFLGIGFSIGAAIWIASIFLPEPLRIWCWVLGFVVELLVPLFNTRAVLRTPYDASHIPERFGLFTIIVLGEAVIGATMGLSGTDWRLTSTLAAAGAFAIATALWWIYFEFLETSVVLRWRRSGQIYVYGHLPVVLGLTMIGVAARQIPHEAIEGATTDATRWILCGGIALYLIALSVIRIASNRRDLIGARLATATIALLLALLGDGLHPLLFEGILFLALVTQIVLETRSEIARREIPAPDVAPEPDMASRAVRINLPTSNCSHLEMINDVTPSADGCQECLALGEGWVEVRICLTCGHVGCCDTSRHRHAARHFEETGHPLIETFEPGPKWRWCYSDETYLPAAQRRS